jgi:amidase
MGSSTFEWENAINDYLVQHPDAPIRTYMAIVESPLLIEGRSPLFFEKTRRDAMVESLGHVPTEPAFLLQLRARDELRMEILKAMAENRLDALVYATLDHTPTPSQRSTPGTNGLLASNLGYPALIVPGAFSSDGLPLGIEFLGLPFAEGTLFKAAYDFEQSTKYRLPPAITPVLSK